MEILFYLVLLGAGLLYWSDGTRAREILLAACQRECRSIQAQLLDDTVIVERQWPSRDQRGNLCIGRAYRFEFSLNGADRHPGYGVVIGRRVEYLKLHLPDGRALYEQPEPGVGLH